MGAESEFPEENWFRIVGRRTVAGVVAFCIESQRPPALSDFLGQTEKVLVHSDQGWSNLALLITNTRSGEKSLLRIKRRPEHLDSTEWSSYPKEAWCARSLQEALPLPEVLQGGLGYFDLQLPGEKEPTNFAFLIQKYIPAVPAQNLLSTAHHPRFITKLGEICRIIHNVETSGAGGDFDRRTSSFAFKDMAQMLANETAVMSSAIDSICQSPKEADTLRNILTTAAPACSRNTLAHRDLLINWGDLLIGKRGELAAVIDWEFSFGGAALELEIASMLFAMLRDGYPLEAREERLTWFLKGYGLSRRAYLAHHADLVEALTLWHALQAIYKYQRLVEENQLDRQPWRKTFSERASHWISARMKSRFADRGKVTPTIINKKVA